MRIAIDKAAGIPMYIQIKDQIKTMIAEGALIPGERLPTERELADELKVSRNTVSMAYQELQEEGVLSVGQGRGTFVTVDQPTNAGGTTGPLERSRKEKVLRLIDLAIEESLDLGFSLDQFLALVMVRAREKEESLRKARVLFVDCNQEQLHNFIRQFRELVRVEIIPLLLEKFLVAGPEIAALVREADLIVTTTTHWEAVQRTVVKLGAETEIVSVAAQPQLENLIKLIRLAHTGGIGLICLSPEFPEIVRRALARLGVYDLQLDYTIATERAALQSFIDGHDILLAYVERYKEVKALAGEKEVIPYIHELDIGSVNLVRRAIDRAVSGREKRGS
ncbi:GntR family transcriptional regulator [Hydrogenispora ethanolica]|uniref:GntR family transcriptional regulator n=1 Tax=Hydrogenispora ethanolica TaxID=1082276 RepID=A0A4R1R9Q6_HYDET|nr:GntR family transcriptional regulator [Hydrogenispora ethanolica]TCL62451.1 GntR family transcriptional regulator [Hydrogenispora ethanolica]